MTLLAVVQAFATAMTLVLVLVTVQVTDMLRLADEHPAENDVSV